MIPLDAGKDCVILTRFNLPSIGVESMIRAQDGWLRNRVELFERYCLPSVLDQTDGNLHWIIYFDPESPQWLLERMAPHIKAGEFTPVYRETATPAEVVEDLHRTVGASTAARVITISLDNDDALARDFVERVRAVGATDASLAIYFENGLVRHGSRLYLRRDPTNAFCCVDDPWDAPRTCWADWHNLLGAHMSVSVVGGAPAWLQVVHGQNVSNRVRGKLVVPSPYMAAFAPTLGDMSEPGIRARAEDLIVGRPLRFMRETVRAGVKGAAMRLLGKTGWSRAKHMWRTVRDRVRNMAHLRSGT